MYGGMPEANGGYPAGIQHDGTHSQFLALSADNDRP